MQGDELKLSASSIKAGEPLTAEVAISRSGKLAGDEVAERYLKFPQVDGAPLLALRGFERIHLAPGETRKVVFHLTQCDLNMVSVAGDPEVAEGRFTLFIGGAQPAETKSGAMAQFNIGGTAKIPE